MGDIGRWVAKLVARLLAMGSNPYFSQNKKWAKERPTHSSPPKINTKLIRCRISPSVQSLKRMKAAMDAGLYDQASPPHSNLSFR
jgi:hypothetical protein